MYVHTAVWVNKYNEVCYRGSFISDVLSQHIEIYSFLSNSILI